MEGGSDCYDSRITYIGAHVPMSPQARTFVLDEWYLIKVS